MMMLMTLSHCVVVKTFLVCGSAAVVSASRAASAFLSRSFARMISASSNFFSYSSRAFFVFSAIFLPAATRFGLFCFVTGIVEVTCWVESTGG